MNTRVKEDVTVAQGFKNRGPALALIPLLGIGGLVVLGLLLLSPLYGFHRDELYFIVAGRHPALGYVDQPSFTPFVSAGAVSLFGLSPTAIRILPAFTIGACVVIAGLIARDLGGGRRAQLLAAMTLAISGYLAAGHLDSTATYDLLAWSLVLLITMRLLAGADPRLWLVVGAIVGLGLENKQILLFLGASLIAGFVLARRWDILRSPWAWAGLALAILLWAPNLAWQASNGYPQLQMAGQIGAGSDNRVKLIPELLLLGGPLLFPISLAGAWWLLRAPASRPWRAVGLAVPILLVLVLLTGGKSYYAAGVFAPLMAAGAVRLDGWLDRGRSTIRRSGFALAAGASFVITAVLVLPILPAPTLAASPIPGIYKESAEQLGWPELVATVEHVVAGLPADQRDRAVILTDNYGEAGALAAPWERPAAHLFRPQLVLDLGATPRRSHRGRGGHPRHERGFRPVLGAGNLQPRHASRQRARSRQPGAGRRRLGLPEPHHSVVGRLGAGQAPRLRCDAQAVGDQSPVAP